MIKEYLKYLVAKKYKTNELFVGKHNSVVVDYYYNQKPQCRIVRQAKKKEIKKYFKEKYNIKFSRLGWHRVPEYIKYAYKSNDPFFKLITEDKNVIIPLSDHSEVTSSYLPAGIYNYIEGKTIGLNELSPSINFANKITKEDLVMLEKLFNNEDNTDEYMSL